MNRADKRVLARLMKSPLTLYELYASVRLPRWCVREALHSLSVLGYVSFDGQLYHTNSIRRERKS